MNKFIEFREKYPNFIYDKYEITLTEEKMLIKFYFAIENLTTFTPQLEIARKDIKNDSINEELLHNLVFHIGLVEAISYYKATVSKNFIINCGYLDIEQQKWFQKLYYLGLGEFRYRNAIKCDIDDFITFKINAPKQIYKKIAFNPSGNLICIGGGKDSAVSLELLKNEPNNACFGINPKEESLNCATLAGITEIYTINRIIDKNIIELNNQGFFNGHTPFSALVSFTSYLMAYLTNRKYIVLSNEGSSNEGNIKGEKINHQYSKTYEYECDFNNYTDKYFDLHIIYFSFLRPLSEFQIAKLFCQFKKYHPVFRSCGLGSKNKNWNWCCKCPKCLFTFIILSPFIDIEILTQIFNENMLDKKDMLATFEELIGVREIKPFDCVGTFDEVNYALKLALKKYEKLPYLLQYYQDNYDISVTRDIEHEYNQDNNLNEYFENILKEALKWKIK